MTTTMEQVVTQLQQELFSLRAQVGSQVQHWGLTAAIKSSRVRTPRKILPGSQLDGNVGIALVTTTKYVPFFECG